MAEYIDRKALLKHYRALANIEWNKTVAPISWSDAYEEIADHIAELPTADVVPKSEVDKLQTEIEELQAKVARLRKENVELLISKETDVLISMEKLVKVRTEHPIFKAIEEKVAREIFEGVERILEVKIISIEEMLFHNTASKEDVEQKKTFEEVLNDLAELKKKYTEEKKHG